MGKIILMTLVIFMAMVGFDHYKNDIPAPTPGQKEQLQIQAKAAKGKVMDLLPEKNTWPEPLQKFYLAFHMEEVIEPILSREGYVPLKAMSQAIPQALIAIEDHDFYNHGAIAPEGIMRAAFVNLTSGQVVQGGSTLTQQLVKNLFLTQEQTLSRKVEEAILSLMLEENYSKDDVLELYLNTAYLGAGAYGVGQASQIYFNKVPSALTLAEAAVIAALPYAPSALNPLENPQGCKQRQLLVLATMHKRGFINQGQYEEALDQTVYLTNGTSL